MAYKVKTDLAHRTNYGAKRSTSAIKYIVLHYTANDGDTDEANAKYFKTANRKASAHYFVDDDSVTISVPDNYVAYSVGGARYGDYKKTGGAALYNIATNANTLNIEMCDTLKNGKYDVAEKTLENAVILTRELMKKYNIPVANVIRHFDVTGKYCPAYYMDNAKWVQFKARISGQSLSSLTVYGGLDYAPVFDATYYAGRYKDLKVEFGNDAAALFRHFITYGMNEGRQAIDTFNVQAYKARYLDLQKTFGENLSMYYRHYIQFGQKEKRNAL